MFYPHNAEIQIERDEPEGINVVRRAAQLKVHYRSIANHVVAKDILKSPKNKKKTQKKIRAIHEFDARLKSSEKFMDVWNWWREFYWPDLPPMKIKNKGQLTCIESIYDLAEENDIEVAMLVATTFKAFYKMNLRIKPAFTTVLSRGVEYYTEFYDDVRAEIDKLNYEIEADR